MKNRSVKEDLDSKDSNKEKGFVRGLEQAQYEKPLYTINPLIDLFFYNRKITKRGTQYVHQCKDIKQKETMA